jgi:type IV secretory pathway VirB10-like protein
VVKLSFLILFFLLLSGAGEREGITEPKETKPQSKEAQLDKKKPANQQNATAKIPAIKQPSRTETDRPTSDDQTPKQKTDTQPPVDSDWWFNSILVVFTGCLVIVGAVQAYIYFRQARYMREGLGLTRQTAQTAKDSAETASRQTEIMANRDRAWIMVKPDGEPKEDPNKLPWGYEIKWSAINVGGTPAFLSELFVDVDIIQMPIPDSRPDYSASRPFAKFIIPPNGRHSSKVSKTFSPTMQGAYFRGDSCVVLYGMVKYQDAIGKHISRFCCYWHVRGGDSFYEPVGPPDWIEYT